MNKDHYVWKNGTVLCENIPNTTAAKNLGLLNLLCVDSSCIEPGRRYGKYHDVGWQSVLFADFPAEFKVQLLLLGVPT